MSDFDAELGLSWNYSVAQKVPSSPTARALRANIVTLNIFAHMPSIVGRAERYSGYA